MARVRNMTGEPRWVPEARMVVPPEGVINAPDHRASEWAKQPGWVVETPPQENVSKAKKGNK